MEFRLAADLLFAVDKADLNPRAKRELAAIAVKIKDGHATRAAVVGYTDDQGADAYNAKLSERRAASVRAALVTVLGSAVTVTATGKGEADPIADNKTKAGQALNRRVTITVKQ
jgi:outer membrane protein OmpA-like peptidoglycan-associated protein